MLFAGAGGRTAPACSVEPCSPAQRLRPAVDDRPVMTGDACRRLAVALVITCAGAQPVFITSALIVQIAAELIFDVEKLGIAVGAYFIAGTLTSSPMGRWSERLGPTASLKAGGLLSAMCLALIAGAWSFPTLCACMVLGGVCNALCQTAANLYVTRSIDVSRRGLAIALKQSAIPAATLVGGLALPLIALTVGWRWAFVLCAAVAAVTTLMVPEVRGDLSGAVDDGRSRARLAAMLLLALTASLGAAAAGCIASFAVAGATRIGFAAASAGWLTALGAFLAVTTRIFMGYRADQRSGGHLPVVAGMLAVACLGGIGLRFQSPAIFALAVPVVFAAGWGWPGLFNLAVIAHNPAAPAAATGFTQTGTYAGAALGPMLFGLVATQWSWTAAWTLVPCFYVCSSLCAVAARRELRRHG